MSTVIVVGSTNLLKVRAVRRGFASWQQIMVQQNKATECGVHIKAVALPECADVPPQPFGMQQTQDGAIYRARTALKQEPSADFGVGIENGIFLFREQNPGEGGIDAAIVCIASRTRSWSVTTAMSGGIQIGGRYIELSLHSLQQKTCGQFLAEQTGVTHDDWHMKHTGGVTNREDILTHAVLLAFSTHFAGY